MSSSILVPLAENGDPRSVRAANTCTAEAQVNIVAATRQGLTLANHCYLLAHPWAGPLSSRLFWPLGFCKWTSLQLLPTKCKKFGLRGGVCHQSLGDVSLICWMKGLFCAYLPAPLILNILNKINQEKARVTLVAPTWLKQVWYTYLMCLTCLFFQLPTISSLLSQDSGLCLSPPILAVLNVPITAIC